MPPLEKRRVLLGLIGSPIKSSASPAMHEAAAAAAGFKAFYHLIDVAGADHKALRLMLEGVRRLGFAGVNITFPYKEAVLPLLDEIVPEAAAIGAVNTVVVRDGRLVGYNTDTTGFERALAEVIAAAQTRPVALVGAGGVGKAIAFALARQNVPEIRIVERDSAKAEALLASLPASAGARICATVEEAVAGAGGLINGTPVGMLPNRDTPVPLSLITADMWVADAVYTPLWTPLLGGARQRGAQVMTGRELAIFQGLDAFRLFTGVEASREAVSAAFDAVMEERASRATAA
ncbi:shikimate dehydrogenase [Microvirga sp. 2TAF3]|uniref:shikimate dehydrogenase n=1 Tax=Microvirga sp. 2TAF3 TaxID=3233014 RepID=UPI003F95519F